MKPLTHEWVAKAEGDFAMVGRAQTLPAVPACDASSAGGGTLTLLIMKTPHKLAKIRKQAVESVDDFDKRKLGKILDNV